MQATVELQVVPLGDGVSVRTQIESVVEMLNGYGFVIETHSSGTNIEGELDDIFKAVAQVHAALHAEGSVRLLSYIKVETRTDKEPTLAGKKL